jgi:hypothetical protein
MPVRLTGTVALAIALAVVAGCSGGYGPTYPSPDTVSIDGEITDVSTGEGIPGVTVRIGDQSTVTDRAGRYHLTDVEPGVHAVMIEPPAGYMLAGNVSEVSIEEGWTNLTGIYLAPDIELPPPPPPPPADD